VHFVSRPVLICLAYLRLLLPVQLLCWGEVLVMKMQPGGALPYLPSSVQRILSASPLELIHIVKTALREDVIHGRSRSSAAPPAERAQERSLAELLRPVRAAVATARAIAPLLLLPDEHRDEALAILPPHVLAALERPVAQLLPSAAKAALMPWESSEYLKVRRGLPKERPPTNVPTETPPDLHDASADAAVTEELIAALGAAATDETSADTRSPPGDDDAASRTSPSPTPASATARAAPFINHSGGATASASVRGDREPRRAQLPTGTGLAPEVLVFRLAAQGLSKMAMRQVEQTRRDVLTFASTLTSSVIGTVLAPGRWGLRIVGKVVAGGCSAGNVVLSRAFGAVAAPTGNSRPSTPPSKSSPPSVSADTASEDDEIVVVRKASASPTTAAFAGGDEAEASSGRPQPERPGSPAGEATLKTAASNLNEHDAGLRRRLQAAGDTATDA
jgi:hypothetical protein